MRQFSVFGIALLIQISVGIALAAEESKHFAFVNSTYIITAEVASERSFVVNFINLSDFVIVVQPKEFIYKGASGRFYIGQVYEDEHTDMRGEKIKYSASVLMKGRTFLGLKLLGYFRELEQIDNLSIRIGAKRFYLQPLDKSHFDTLASKISDLDMQSEDMAATLQRAGLAEMGNVKSTDGTSEWDRDWQGLIDPDGLNMPKIIERPEIAPTPEARRTNTYGKVKLAATLNRNGGIQDLKLVKGLGHGLDQKAIDAVKNSWLFLPATKNGEVLDSSFTFEVDFSPPPPAKK